jgi:hypothetical protein
MAGQRISSLALMIAAHVNGTAASRSYSALLKTLGPCKAVAKTRYVTHTLAPSFINFVTCWALDIALLRKASFFQFE